MKAFRSVDLDVDRAGLELQQFEKLLVDHDALAEQQVILPFFKARVQLTTLLGWVTLSHVCDLVAYEYPLFGDFKADLALGNLATRNYALIEFEDGTSDSIFCRKGRATPYWSERFENGYNQIIDWFWKLADSRNTQAFRNRFGDNDAGFKGALVIGRDAGLTLEDQQRLDWRSSHVVVESRHVQVMTYDRLARDLRAYYDGLPIKRSESSDLSDPPI
jgi:hypothetical protein